jgi:hypothetical protein
LHKNEKQLVKSENKTDNFHVFRKYGTGGK